MPYPRQAFRDRLPMVAFVLGAGVLVAYAANVNARYFLCDDAFISFRYARHLVDGHGLVWNEGYRVEGYSNFLWVLLMAAGMRVGIEPELLAPALGIASGGALLASFVLFLAKRHGLTTPTTWLPVVVLALNPSFGSWTTSGLETMFFSALVLAGVLRTIAAHDAQDRVPWDAAVCFALATLTRPDGAVFTLAAGIVLTYDVLRGRRRLSSVVAFSAIYLAPVLAHVAWRYGYYGYLVPNTFYAKVNGVWLTQAYDYFALFHGVYQVLWFAPFVVLAAFGTHRYVARVFLLVLATYLAYVASVGGGRFEFRLLVAALPYLYWLVVAGIAHAATVLDEKSASTVVRRAFRLVMFGVFVIANAIGTPHLVQGDSRYAGIPPLRLPLTTTAALTGIEPVLITKEYARDRIRSGRLLARLVREGYYPTDLPMVVGGAGALPYYAMIPVVDRFGLNNVEIAHAPVVAGGAIAHQHDISYEMLVAGEYPVLTMYPLIQQKTLDALDEPHFHHGHRLRMRALALPYGGYFIFATFVQDAELRRLFPRMALILPRVPEVEGQPTQVDP